MKNQKGRVFGLKTKKGIAILQIAENTVDSKALYLARVCDGFLNENYCKAEIQYIIEKKELFFLYTPLTKVLSKKNRIYKEFLAFDCYFDVPISVKMPEYLRGYTIDNKGEIHWYIRRRGDYYRTYIDKVSLDFLELSPDDVWSLPDLQEFLEAGKKIQDYIFF